MPNYPVFVVGSPRSGTSILVDALLNSGYYGYREGMLLSLIHSISTVVERHFKTFEADPATLLAAVDKNQFKSELLEPFKRAVDSRNAKAPWFDKTGNPEMIEVIPKLREFWPDSTFIFAKRRGVENIVSRLRKFPGHSFEYHCRDWARNMRSWRMIRNSIPSAARLEVDQQDIARSPTKVADNLTSLLNLDRLARDVIEDTFKVNRPQQTAVDTTFRVLSLDTAGWSENQKQIFMQECAEEMRFYNYTYDDLYTSPT